MEMRLHCGSMVNVVQGAQLLHKQPSINVQLVCRPSHWSWEEMLVCRYAALTTRWEHRPRSSPQLCALCRMLLLLRIPWCQDVPP
ncbi:uncharacterized protein LOC119181252 isoform X3 [Rhipicephalus microplus]|uniref:uncharacterized protein LOC119181252 isoform X3 n=1 Tax=Rhipicephalus microplus TaxID=6941 RepID=UPI003F6CC7F8